jgi:hypothetical protein
LDTMREEPYGLEFAAMRDLGDGLVHEGGHLDYSTGTREASWVALRIAVRDRLTQLAGGERTEWWAWHQGEGSHMAVVLGPAALCQADPGVKPDGLPGHRVRTARFVPGSLCVTASGDPIPGSSGVGGASGLAAPPVLGGVLSAEFRSFLGNLAPSTQMRLQQPFTRSRNLLYNWWYQDTPGSPHTWTGLCYIADQQSLTFASTTRDIGPSGLTRSWHATCYQAILAAPMPAPEQQR